MVLNSNVYFIKGESGSSCIYDLREKYAKIFHLNSEGTRYIDNILSEEIVDLSDAEQLINLGVLVDIPDMMTAKPADMGISFAWIEITKSCPYKCVHCYNESNEMVTECHMSYEDACIVIDRLVDYGIKKIQLIGGEPLIHPYFEDILKLCIDKFEDIEIFTNGMDIKTELIDVYVRNKVKFALSIYSDIESEYEKVTGIRGSFERLQNSIAILDDNNIQYRLETVRMRGIDYTDKFAEKMREKADLPRMAGAASFDLYDENMMKEKCITEEKIFNLSSKIKSDDIRQRMKCHNCFARKLYIDKDLNCYPCVMERELCHGNIRNSDIKSVIKEEICSLNKDCIEQCKKCEYRYVCFDCRPDRIEDGVYAKPWYCLYDPQKGQWQNANTVFCS